MVRSFTKYNCMSTFFPVTAQDLVTNTMYLKDLVHIWGSLSSSTVNVFKAPVCLFY